MQNNPSLPSPYIHSDVYTTMTGFTRFMHENDRYSSSNAWRYNKTENMPDSGYSVYTHLLTNRTNFPGFVQYKNPFKQYDCLNLQGFLWKPFTSPLFVFEDKVYILERKDVYALRTSARKKKWLSILLKRVVWSKNSFQDFWKMETCLLFSAEDFTAAAAASFLVFEEPEISNICKNSSELQID